MKILHALPRLDAEAGGPTGVAIGLVEALNRIPDIQAEIVTVRGRDHDRLPLPFFDHSTIHEGVPVWFLPAGNWRVRSFTPSLAYVKWARTHVRDYDIIHIHYLFSFTTLVTGAFALWHGKPFVIRPLGQLAAWSLKQRRLLKALWAVCIDRPLLRRAAFVHATSEQEARDIEAFGVETRVVVVPPGISLPPDEVSVGRTARPMILFLSRLHPKKRPELVIELLAELVANGIDAELVFAGSGEPQFEALLRQKVVTCGLGDRVSFRGFVGGDDKLQLLRSASVFVLPSQAENFGVAVAEAMAAGCPVVVTRGVDIAGDIERSGAGSVAEANVQSLTTAVSRVLSDPLLANKMGAAGRAYAREHWCWPKIAASLVREYNAALHS